MDMLTQVQILHEIFYILHIANSSAKYKHPTIFSLSVHKQ